MKKFMSMVLVVLSLISCMSVTAFAADVAKVYPLSEAPAMERSQRIGPVTFSNVVSCKEVDDKDDNGEDIHVYRIIMGVGTSSRASMKSTSSNVEFIYFPETFNCKDNGHVDGDVVTGELSCIGRNAFVDLVHYSILPYMQERRMQRVIGLAALFGSL